MHIFAGTLVRKRCGRVVRWGAVACVLMALLGGCGRMVDGWRRMRGDALRHAGDEAGALRWYERIATNRQDVAVLRALAELYAARGDVTNLQAVSERLCALVTDAEELQGLAELRAMQDDHEGAVMMLERAVALTSNKWNSHALLIEKHLERGETNAAAGAVERAEQVLPRNRANRQRLAVAWMRLGDTSNAIKRLSELLEEDADDHQMRLALAALQIQGKDYAAAVTNVQMIVKAPPDNAIAAATLADALNALGEVGEAVRWYRRAIRLDQRNATALNNLAYVLLLHTSNVTEAIELARSSVAIERAAHALDTLGYAYYLRGQDDVAMKYLREAEQMREERGEPVDAELHLHIGMVHARREEMEFAALRVGKALAVQPELEKYIKTYAWYSNVMEAIQSKRALQDE